MANDRLTQTTAMQRKRSKIYSNDLIEITESFLSQIKEIEGKLSADLVVNKGLFVMITSSFEDSIRDLLRTVLIAFPEKLNKLSCTISRKQLSEIAEKGHSVIIDNELYSMFREGVQSQLIDLQKILFNKSNIRSGHKNPKNPIDNYIVESIRKIHEISLFRNALIHNGGKASTILFESAKYYKEEARGTIIFNAKLVSKFINEYENFILNVNREIRLAYKSSTDATVIEKTKNLWNECFSSPILNFDDYWDINIEKDLIVGIKYPIIESQISSSEKVFLSIWRHQFSDNQPTEDFLLCSIDYHKIYELYKGLDALKFYHMQQKSQ